MHLRKRVLVTGGAGFLGSHLCDRLLSKGYDILCVDNFYTGRRMNIAHLMGDPMFEVLRHDVTDPAVIQGWVENLDYARVLPLLAVINNQIVGNATLHRKGGPYRHIGEVRIYLAKDYRGRGLGTEMIKTLIDLARKEGLHQLRAEVFASQPKVIRAFELRNPINVLEMTLEKVK